MRNEAHRKLDRHVALKGAARWLGLIIGAVTLAALAIIVYHPGGTREIPAVVRVAVAGADQTGTRYTHLELDLQDGRIVVAGSAAPLPPPATGARIIVREHTSALGFRSYLWEGQTQ